MPRKPIVLAPEVLAEVVRLYVGEGLSGEAVARRTGLSSRVVFRSLRLAGASRPSGPPRLEGPTEAERERERRRELRQKRRMRGEHSLADSAVQEGLEQEMTSRCSCGWTASGVARDVIAAHRAHSCHGTSPSTSAPSSSRAYNQRAL